MSKRVVNLDEYKVAAAEDGPPEVILGGESFVLPAEYPILLLVALKKGDFEASIKALFGKNAKKALDAGLSLADLDRIGKEVYGLSKGESEASPT